MFDATSASRGNLNLGSDWTVSRITALRLFESTLFVLRVISQHLTAKLISLSPCSSVCQSRRWTWPTSVSPFTSRCSCLFRTSRWYCTNGKTHISCFSRLYQTVNLRPPLGEENRGLRSSRCMVVGQSTELGASSDTDWHFMFQWPLHPFRFIIKRKTHAKVNKLIYKHVFVCRLWMSARTITCRVSLLCDGECLQLAALTCRRPMITLQYICIHTYIL